MNENDEILAEILTISKEKRDEIRQLMKELLQSNKSAQINSFAGKRHTLESRRKMSMARLGNKNCVGRVLSDETKRKIGAAQLGSKRNVGHKHTEETKRKISESRTGLIATPETRAKMSESQKLRYLREKTNK